LDIQELRQQESEMNAALAECVPASMPRTQLEVAMSLLGLQYTSNPRP